MRWLCEVRYVRKSERKYSMNKLTNIVCAGGALAVAFGAMATSLQAKDVARCTEAGAEGKALSCKDKITVGRNSHVLSPVAKAGDLGPCVNGRVLDLSRGAAEALGMKKDRKNPKKIYHCEP